MKTHRKHLLSHGGVGMLKIKYFGRLHDELACYEEQVEWAGGSGEVLLTQLRLRGEKWAESLAAGRVFRLVVNQRVVACEVEIPDGAEVGILPPVSGG